MRFGGCPEIRRPPVGNGRFLNRLLQAEGWRQDHAVIQFLSGAGTTILSAILTWSVTTATRKRADAKADRATVRAQADALIVAVSEVRAMASTNKLLWGSWKETGRSFLLALLAGSRRARTYRRSRSPGRPRGAVGHCCRTRRGSGSHQPGPTRAEAGGRCTHRRR